MKIKKILVIQSNYGLGSHGILPKPYPKLQIDPNLGLGFWK